MLELKINLSVREGYSITTMWLSIEGMGSYCPRKELYVEKHKDIERVVEIVVQG